MSPQGYSLRDIDEVSLCMFLLLTLIPDPTFYAISTGPSSYTRGVLSIFTDLTIANHITAWFLAIIGLMTAPLLAALCLLRCLGLHSSAWAIYEANVANVLRSVPIHM